MLAWRTVSIRGRTQQFEASSRELSPTQLDIQYGGLLNKALIAFTQDPSYLIDIAEHGSLIKHKKRLWAVRMEALNAEKEARRLCSLNLDFICTNSSACGFGRCRWATPEHANIKLAPPSTGTKKSSERPVPSKSPSYRIEDAIQALIQQHKIVAPAKLSSGRRAH